MMADRPQRATWQLGLTVTCDFSFAVCGGGRSCSLIAALDRSGNDQRVGVLVLRRARRLAVRSTRSNAHAPTIHNHQIPTDAPAASWTCGFGSAGGDGRGSESSVQAAAASWLSAGVLPIVRTITSFVLPFGSAIRQHCPKVSMNTQYSPKGRLGTANPTPPALPRHSRRPTIALPGPPHASAGWR